MKAWLGTTHSFLRTIALSYREIWAGGGKTGIRPLRLAAPGAQNQCRRRHAQQCERANSQAGNDDHWKVLATGQIEFHSELGCGSPGSRTDRERDPPS